MGVREARVSGLEYLALVTKLLQRARLTDAEAGVWEAADLQWWWRAPRRSDAIGQLFWVDDEGPVAAFVVTDWGGAWECDPILVPRTPALTLRAVWASGMEAVHELGLEEIEVLAREDDVALLGLLTSAGFVPGQQYWTAWMDARDRAEVVSLPAGFALVDRAGREAGPHPMRRRNGEEVEARLRQSPLYDPALDLAVEAADGEIAGYALFWFDPVTGVGLVEPMRVEEPYQRKGLARAILTEGLDRLARRGARRMKVGFGTEEARGLYLGAGFRVTSSSRSYRRRQTADARPVTAEASAARRSSSAAHLRSSRA